MKIVILDAHTSNPGDLSWETFRALGDCDIHSRTAPEQIVPRAREAEALLTNKVPLGREQLAALPRLRYIGVLATGYNVVDLAAARERGLVVTNVPDYGSASVAQAVFALLLELTNHAGHHSRRVREGAWSAAPDFCFWEKPLIELSGLNFGIVGFGQIGQRVARIAQALEMKVLVSTRTPSAERHGIELVSLEELFRRSDYVSLHCPLTPETKGLINTARLQSMKPGAFLLNTARGGLVVEADLAAALNEGRLAGAGLDVLSVEPPPADNPLLQARNCVITPHIAWATQAARRRLIEMAAENLRSFLAGQPRNVVS